MSELSTEIVVAGLAFPEGPRWHDDRLVFSDMHGHRVVALDPTTLESSTLCVVECQPSGIGWLPDGRMLVVSMTDRRVLRQELDGTIVEHSDLSTLAPWHCNDMVVSAEGRAYVGNFGFDIYAAQPEPRTTTIVRVDPDGTASIAADKVSFPNGSVITPDGRTLIVGESWSGRLIAWDIADDGSLHGRRVWAELQGHVPDGICLDAEGALWIACPLTGDVVRVLEGDTITDTVSVSTGAFACMLGGDSRTTLYVCAATTSHPEEAPSLMAGTIESVRVEVPGAGWP